jgi:hypothetical protein
MSKVATETVTTAAGAWYDELDRIVEPVLDEETGDVIGWAVVALADGEWPDVWAGIIAVVKHETGRKARQAAGWIARKPEFIDLWRENCVDLALIGSIIDLRDRAPFTALPFTPNHLADPASDLYLDRLHEVMYMADLVHRRRPPLDPLRILFDRAASEDDAPGTEERPAPIILAHAMAAFEQMPESESAEILNGWRYPDGFSSFSELIGMTVQCHFDAMPYLIMGDDDAPADKLDWTLTDCSGGANVLLYVPLGTTKVDALAAAREIVKRLEREWDKLIVMPEDG